MGIGSLKAVFLDRDGVLNRAIVRDGKPYPPANADELEILPDAPEALAALKAAGFLLLVATNQPDVARGRQQRSVVESIHEKLRGALPIDDFLVCYHDDRDGCDCRKPNPGLLLQAATRYHLDLPACYMVGDRWRDIEAGQAAGCSTVWIDRGYAERGPSPAPGVRVNSCLEAARWILQRAGSNKLNIDR